MATVQRFAAEVGEMIHRPIPLPVQLLWKYIIPVLLAVLLFLQVRVQQPP